jgi:hypothetical protein
VKEVIVGFEVLAAVVVKSSIFWDITPFSPFEVDRRFGGKLRSNFNRLHGVISQKISSGRLLVKKD